jgi:hypothetical protein
MKGGLAEPNLLIYSSGCPAQASLGRGFQLSQKLFAIAN